MLASFVLAASLVLASVATAKQVVDYFGTDPAKFSGGLGGEFGAQSFFGPPNGIAVNQSGVGPADAGDIYVVEGTATSGGQNRIQRFHHDDNGTPSDPYDDEYEFVSAWGADVVQAGGEGDKGDSKDADYEICTVASECQAGVSSGGNGTPAGNGSLSNPSGIAVDQDTGHVYVADAGNARVNVYAGDGTFLRSLGWDVVASGPGKEPAPNEVQQLTVKADGGKFSLSFRGATTGARAKGLAVSGNQVTQVEPTSGTFEVGQAFSAFAFGKNLYPLGTTVTAVVPGFITLSANRLSGGSDRTNLFGDDLPYSITAAELESELNSLPSIGGVGGSVTVTGGPADSGGSSPFTIEFGGTLAGDDVPQLEVSAGGLLLGGGAGAAEVQTQSKGGAYEICDGSAGDVCQAGNFGSGVGQSDSVPFRETEVAIAVSSPDGDPDSGTVFWADKENRRVNTFSLDGSDPGSFGSDAQFGSESPVGVAVDSRGIVYATDTQGGGEIERFDSENANGGGVGFIVPISTGVNEIQKVTVSATEGTYHLTFKGEATVDLPYNAQPVSASGSPDIDTVREALEALPAIGPGNVEVGGGSSIYEVAFVGGLAAEDQPELVAASGTPPLGGGSGVNVTTTTAGQSGLAPTGGFAGPTSGSLAIDPDSDGAGPDADVLYALRPSVIQQLGPVNSPGLSASPTGEDDRHAEGQFSVRFLPDKVIRSSPRALALDEQSGHIFLTAEGGAGQDARGVYVLHDAGGPPSASLDAVTGVTATGATVNATVNPNGGPTVSYHLEYSTDGSTWTALPDTVLGTQTTPQALAIPLDPPGGGLDPDTAYQVRLVATKRFAAPTITAPLSFTTLPDAPEAQSMGSPLRTATTAQLAGRVNPRGAVTSFYFEYGSAPCDANPCTQTTPQSAGSGREIQLVGARLTGLEPNTTYHYRVVADNGNPGSPVGGEDTTFTTRASDKGLSHGAFPGPPGSDRAWEQVSMAEANGNPVVANISTAFSTDGNRAVYGMGGGNPLSDTGTAFSQYLAERTPSGWQTLPINPPRSQLVGPSWQGLTGADELSVLYGVNLGDAGERALFRVSPEAPAAKLFEADSVTYAGSYVASGDGSRIVVALNGAPDPAFPAANGTNLYDLSSGSPQLASVLPGGVASGCGSIPMSSNGPAKFAQRLLSPDGRFLFFTSEGPGCDGTTRLYVRDFSAAETKLISGPPLSGLECDASFLKSTPGAAFFATATRLASADSNPASCASSSADRDVYRYDLQDESLDCVSCTAVGSAGVGPDVAVAADGSRVYFTSPKRLLRGAAPKGTYRVDVSSGDIAYLGDLETQIGENAAFGEAINSDGSVLVFYSKASFLNPLGEGQDNGATRQYYRYDDRDGSLACISCPLDGSVPAAEAPSRLNSPSFSEQAGPNTNFVSDAGAVVFRTTEALVGIDQNTPGAGGDPNAGMDIYEWRDGRPLLLSDGLTSWTGISQTPELLAMTPSGRDVFFIAPAQLTPDALDGYFRLYDARVGGGFEFPPPPPPCPLEVCQGSPKGAPEESQPASASFSGVGNARKATRQASCRKGKVRRKGRCVVKKKPKRRANHNRGASR